MARTVGGFRFIRFELADAVFVLNAESFQGVGFRGVALGDFV
jgi:hypothetical protein